MLFFQRLSALAQAQQMQMPNIALVANEGGVGLRLTMELERWNDWEKKR